MDTIRRLGPGDGPAFRELRLEALRAEPEAFGSDYLENLHRPVEFFVSRLEAASNCTLGAFDGVRLVGMVGFHRPEGIKVRHRAEVFGMFVAASHRRRGLGRRMLEALIEAARAEPELLQLQLAVTTTLGPARALYDRLGFVPFGIEPRGLCVEGRSYDLEHRQLALDRS
jgi:GNAT superfamily N-acetyltransferase